MSATAPAIRIPGSRRPLDRDFILDGALEIIDTHGAKAMTLQALATHLHSGTATLYRHFPNRAALIAAVIDRVLSQIDIDDTNDTTTPWQQVCKCIAQNSFDALAAHSNLASLLIDNTEATPAYSAGRELFLAALLRDGFTPHAARRVYATISHYAIGFAMQLPHQDHAQHQEPAPAAARRDFTDADPANHPATATIAASAPPLTLAEEFTYGLDMMLLGIERLHDHQHVGGEDFVDVACLSAAFEN